MDQVLQRNIAGGGAEMSGAAGRRPYLSPRARRRMWWLTVHRWLGLALLVPMAVLGLTGSALVWPEQTDALVNPQRQVAATADPVNIGVAHIAAAREALAPYGPIASIKVGEVGEPLIASSAPHSPPLHGIGGPVREQAYVDPESAQVIDTAPSAGTFSWYMHFIHGLFLIPGWGRQLVGWMGVFLVASALSGLVIFWPGRARFVAALKWQKRDGKALNLHRQSGVILSLVLVVEAVTGAWISFPAFMAAIVEPGVEQPERRRRGGGGPEGEPLPVEDTAWIAALSRAQSAFDGRPVSLTAPVAPDGAWTIELAGEGVNGSVSLPLAEGSEVTVEQSTARAGPPPASTRAITVSRVMRQVHYATIGGIVWEWLVFLSGLVLAFLSCSGIYVWAKRKLARRRRLGRSVAR